MPKSQPVDVVIPCSAGILSRRYSIQYYHCKSSFNPGGFKDVVKTRANGLIELLSVKSFIVFYRPPSSFGFFIVRAAIISTSPLLSSVLPSPSTSRGDECETYARFR